MSTSSSFVEQATKAHELISPHLVYTPLIKSESLSKKHNRNIYLKLECLQKTGSFKARGAMTNIMRAVETQGKQNIKGVVTASGGNHGLGVCYAAKQVGIPAHVFLFESVSLYKQEAVRKLNGTVHIFGQYWNEANEKAKEFATANDMMYVHPFDNDDIILGQSTATLEAFEQWKSIPTTSSSSKIDAIVCSIGGGGLISGTSSYAKEVHPECKVFGVETAGAAKMYESRKQDKVVVLSKVETIAEGLSTRCACERTFNIVKKHVDDLFLVSDEVTMESLREVLQHDKLFAEPSASCSIAALSQIVEKYPSLENIVVILCGGNFDIQRLFLYSPTASQ